MSMKASEFADLTYDELMVRYRGFKEELLQLRFQHATGQLEKTHRIKEVRRNLARVLTFMGNKETAKTEGSKKS